MKKDMKVRAEMNIVDKGNIMASGDVFLNEMFVIHNVRIMKKMKEDGEMDWFVSMPSRRRGEEWERVVTIKDPDLRKKIEDEVQASAEKALHKDLGDFSLSVDIRLYEAGDTRGYATIVFNDMVQIDNIRISEKDGKLSVHYPYEKSGDYYQNLVGPATIFIKNRCEEQILDSYRAKLQEKETGMEKETEKEKHQETGGKER